MYFLINNFLLRQCDGRLIHLCKKLSFMVSTLHDMLCSPNMDSHMSDLVRVGKPWTVLGMKCCSLIDWSIVLYRDEWRDHPVR